MKSKLKFIVLAMVLLISACTTQQTPAPTVVPSTVLPSSTKMSPTAVPPTATIEPRTLTVLAAASLKDSFTEMAGLFESRNPGVTVSLSFAGSQQLAQQIDQGAPADVFASASKKYIDAAVTSKRVAENAPMVFVTNRLVVIFPISNPASLSSLQDLAKTGLKTVLGDSSVPVGQYALSFLDLAVKDPIFGTDFKDKVLANVVSYETDVKSVVSKVALGEADAGIVYVTDYNIEVAKLGKLDIPDNLNTIANYPIAPISDSENTELAKAFIDLVLSADGQAIMAKYGFIPVNQ